MAKTKQTFAKDVSAFVEALRKKVSAQALDAITREIAFLALDLIRRRARSGKGVAKAGGVPRPFKKLSPRYVDYRRRNANRLSAFTTPGKSNVTFTGQMLLSMRLDKRASASYLITFDGKRTDGKTNSEVAAHVSKSRPFLNLSKDEQERVRRAFARAFDKHVSSR